MKRIFNIATALVLLTGIGACKKDVVDLLPTDRIPVSAAFQNMNDVNNAINGVYASWSARRSVYVSALISDEVRLGTGSAYRNVGNILFNWQHVSDSQDWRDAETGGIWTNLYFVIDRANRVLELMQPVPTGNATEASTKSRYRGEMLAVRAMAHLELLRNYARTPEYTATDTGIIIQRSYVKPEDIASYRPYRNTQREVVNFIDSTLSEARALIPTTFTDISRVTRNAVIGSQVRLYLHTKQWQKVVDSSSVVIAAVPVSSRAVDSTIWTSRATPAGTEVIWKLNVTAANIGNAVGSLFQDLNGAVQASPAVKLLNTFDQANDIRYKVYFRTPTTTPPSSANLIAKYGAVIVGNNTPAENFEYDIKMMRTSELLLARAEAYAELNNLTAANADLNTLRINRILNYVHVPITDKQLLIDAIYLERYKELCYEGQRYYDLRRRSITISRDINDVVGNTVIQNLPANNPKYILPIPQQEVFANPNVGQNPGY